eukprot:TRINITY_DN3860_c0_g3_i1.p1 TRINITY_DN3860_c0_g3~~TRINITY_DN3860_c0_g3_i1.p1  ORF type:complete len:185 (-),score=40.27 TRINITY_DN3860_c0_g3_i1:73-627(-)
MVFKRFVEIGRVALINYGPLAGKLCVIIDVLDQTRAFIDGPSSITGVKRQMMPFRRLSLTDIKITIPHSPRLSTLVKAFKDGKVQEKWDRTAWAKKQVVKQKRESLNDFDRFKVMLARKKRSQGVRKELKKVIKDHRKALAAKVEKAKAANKNPVKRVRPAKVKKVKVAPSTKTAASAKKVEAK